MFLAQRKDKCLINRYSLIDCHTFLHVVKISHWTPYIHKQWFREKRWGPSPTVWHPHLSHSFYCLQFPQSFTLQFRPALKTWPYLKAQVSFPKSLSPGREGTNLTWEYTAQTHWKGQQGMVSRVLSEKCISIFIRLENQLDFSTWNPKKQWRRRGKTKLSPSRSLGFMHICRASAENKSWQEVATCHIIRVQEQIAFTRCHKMIPTPHKYVFSIF